MEQESVGPQEPQTPPDPVTLPTPVPSGSMQKRNSLDRPGKGGCDEDDDFDHDDDTTRQQPEPLTPDHKENVKRETVEESPSPSSVKTDSTSKDDDAAMIPPETPPSAAAAAVAAASSGDTPRQPVGLGLGLGLGLGAMGALGTKEMSTSPSRVRQQQVQRPKKVDNKGIGQLTEEQINEMDTDKLREHMLSVVTIINDYEKCVGDYSAALDHTELQNKLLTIQSHESAQRFEVENGIIKREVDRLRYETNGGLNESAEIYRRRLRKAKAKLRDCERTISEKSAEIEKLRKRIRDSRNYREQLEAAAAAHQHQHQQAMAAYQQHWQQQYQWQQYQQQQQLQQHYQQQSPQQLVQSSSPSGPPATSSSSTAARKEAQAQTQNGSSPAPVPMETTPQPGTGQSTPQVYHGTPLTPQQQQLQSSPSHHTHTPKDSNKQEGLDALGMLASQVLSQRQSPSSSTNHSHANSTEKAELMSPVNFTEPKSSPEKRRRESSASTITIQSEDDHDEHKTEDEEEEEVSEKQASSSSPKSSKKR